MAIAIAKTLLDTLDLRAGSTITETEIAALKKRWGPRGRLANRDPGVIANEEQDFYDALPMRVSDEQGKRGQDYLRKLLFTKAGDLRNTKLIRDQNIGNDHADVLRTLDHFMFTGFHEDYNHFGHVVSRHPVYRAVSCHGQWFEYIARPWVAGQPEFSAVGRELS